jgi:hypothetical protein
VAARGRRLAALLAVQPPFARGLSCLAVQADADELEARKATAGQMATRVDQAGATAEAERSKRAALQDEQAELR